MHVYILKMLGASEIDSTSSDMWLLQPITFDINLREIIRTL